MNNLKQIKDIDVLVIGGGNAGLCAAFEFSAKQELHSWFNEYQVNGYVPIQYECFMSVVRNQ